MISRINIFQYQLKRYAIQKTDKIIHSKFSKPSQVFFGFSGKCNLRCLQCLVWKNKNRPHIKSGELKRIINDLYSYLGPVKISLSGEGEPFMEPGLLDVCEYAASLGIPIIINTNGTLIDDFVAKKIIKTGILGITISIDGIKSHDISRGVEGTFHKINLCIQSLVKWRNYFKSNIRIMINTVIMTTNLEELIDLALWSKSIGASIKYTPLILQPSNNNKYLWPNDKNKLNAVISELKDISKKNGNILNTQRNFDSIVEYYNSGLSKKKTSSCLSMFDRISIRSNEDVLICGNVIGNISRQSIKEILRSTKADEIRNRLKKCDKNCIHNCRTQGSLKDKAKLLLKYCYK